MDNTEFAKLGFNRDQKNWTTRDELVYLKHAGNFYSPVGQKATNPDSVRLELLNKTLTAYKQRANWGNLNSEQIIAFAIQQIQEIEARLNLH